LTQQDTQCYQFVVKFFSSLRSPLIFGQYFWPLVSGRLAKGDHHVSKKTKNVDLRDYANFGGSLVRLARQRQPGRFRIYGQLEQIQGILAERDALE